MSRRFGGRYSPGAPPQRPGPAGSGLPDKARPARGGARVNLMFVLPFVLPVTAFLQQPPGLAADLGAFALLMLAAWLTREGERAHEAWEARTVARRPAIPRKLFASVLTGLGVGLAAWAPGTDAGVLNPVLLGLTGLALHLLGFGPDPLTDKGMEGADGFQTERVATAVAEAEKTLAAMREAARPVADREIAERLDRFAATARTMFRTLENDPRDLTSARRYLSVYLDGARDATARFAQIHAATRDARARLDYLALLDDLDSRFAQRTEVLLSNDRNRLDVEIEVLRERLAQDAPRP